WTSGKSARKRQVSTRIVRSSIGRSGISAERKRAKVDVKKVQQNTISRAAASGRPTGEPAQAPRSKPRAKGWKTAKEQARKRPTVVTVKAAPEFEPGWSRPRRRRQPFGASVVLSSSAEGKGSSHAKSAPRSDAASAMMA